jgi:hypothetical protein
LPGLLVAVYVVILAEPGLKGAVKVTVAVVIPVDVAVPIVGASGENSPVKVNPPSNDILVNCIDMLERD